MSYRGQSMYIKPIMYLATFDPVVEGGVKALRTLQRVCIADSL